MRSQSPKPAQPWPAYAGQGCATHYSPLEDITPANVRALTVASEWGTGEQPLEAFGAQLGNFQNTPLMIDNVPHVSTRSRATRSGRTIDDEPYCVEDKPSPLDVPAFLRRQESQGPFEEEPVSQFRCLY